MSIRYRDALITATDEVRRLVDRLGVQIPCGTASGHGASNGSVTIIGRLAGSASNQGRVEVPRMG
jgi:hypothetical protein